MNIENKSTNVYVTGMGAISAIGHDVNTMEQSLLVSHTGISPISILKTRFRNILSAGEIKLTNEDLKKLIGENEFINSRTLLLSFKAVNEAMSSVDHIDFSSQKFAFVSSTTVGGMDKTEMHYKDFILGSDDTNFIDAHNSGYHGEVLGKHFGFKNIFTINTACSSSANAISLGVRLIKSGKYECVIVGGSDALSAYTINGFQSLMLLDKDPCKPFDKNRSGINLGEASAYLVLESETSINKTGNPILGIVTGYGITNDAFHPTASSNDGKGISIAMKKAISMAGLTISDINYINAHGTATVNNDAAEGMAIKNVFAENVPFFSSTKSFTGHTLAAAGALEAIVSLLAIKNDCAFPNLNFESPITEHGLTPITQIKKNISIKNVLSNSIGIGGFCASLILSKSK